MLFVNDFFLKDLYPSMLTGKLSDFAGLIVFPIFVYFVLGKWKRQIFIIAGLFFIFWKSTLSQGIIDYANGILPFQIMRIVDYTDYIALLSLPFGYFYKPIKIIAFNNSVLKTSLACFALFCILASDTNIRFKNKVKGRTPYELCGEYKLYSSTDDGVEIDTITFTKLDKSKFLILANHTDTMYLGEIKRKNGDYYLNQYDEKTKHWAINCFRIENDSIYNFQSCMWGLSSTSLIEECFDDFNIEETNDIETYFVNNKKRETLQAFDKYLDNKTGYYFIEIIDELDTIAEIIGSTDIIESPEIQKIKAYPNPFVSYITIEYGYEEPLLAKIINVSGQVVKNIELKDRSNYIDLSDLNKGVYIINFNTNLSKDYCSMKIIKR